ncbi:hypothetical protein LP7551_03897 [Roseibium album]|nr:hypothetical protein LP7551_03897 [Roseibium album]
MPVSPVKTHFIDILMAVFRRTPGTDEEGYFKLLSKELARFDPVDLRAAANQIALDADSQTWPPVKHCIRACEVAKAKRLAKDHPKTNTSVSHDEPTLPQSAAMRMLAVHAGELALEACDNDWIVHLLEFVQKNKRIPDESEIVDLKAERDRTLLKVEDQIALYRGKDSLATHFVNVLVEGIQDHRVSVTKRMREKLKAD